MGIGSFFFGSPAKTERFDTLNPQQNTLLQQLLGSINPSQFNLEQNPLYQTGSSYLQSLLGGNLDAFTKPYMDQFNQETIPQLAEQFAGVGGLSSSGFQNAASGAAANLQTSLAALRGGLQNQALGQGLQYASAPGQMNYNLANLGLNTQPFGYNFTPRSPGFLEGLLGQLSGGIGLGASQGIGQGLKSYFGGTY